MALGSVLFFGDINVDNILAVNEIPDPGRDTYANHIEMHLGGAACNSGVILQGLGHPASLFGVVGDDLWADFVFSELSSYGVNFTNVIKKSTGKTGVIFIAVTPNGERTMFSYRGINSNIEPDDIPPRILDGVQLIQFSGYAFIESPQKETAWKLLKMAKDQDIPICMDTGLDPVILKPDLIQEVLPFLTLLITARKEALILAGCREYGSQVDFFLSHGLQQVGIKMGEKGALLGHSGGFEQMPAFPVKVVDTTSAGDAFSTGMIYGYMHNFSHKECLVLANALGGMATMVYGAAKINRPDLLRFLLEVSCYGMAQVYQEVITDVAQRIEGSM